TSSPLMPGRCRSHNTTSGSSLRTSGSASSPLSASPTTSMSVSADRIMRRPVLTSAWSSTRKTRMVMPLPRYVPGQTSPGHGSRASSQGAYFGRLPRKPRMNPTAPLRNARIRSLLGLLLATAALAPLSATADAPRSDTGHAWQAQVVRISDGADARARAAAITDRLDALGIAWQVHEFESDGKRGRNLVATLGGDAAAPLLLIGAHYDRVDVGHGATDNASGVAAVLQLAQALQATPLATHRVKLAFWDLEEHGLLGSRAWVAAAGQEQPALYVNFDVFGWGNTLWMMTPDAAHPLVDALRRASTAE